MAVQSYLEGGRAPLPAHTRDFSPSASSRLSRGCKSSPGTPLSAAECGAASSQGNMFSNLHHMVWQQLQTSQGREVRKALQTYN